MLLIILSAGICPACPNCTPNVVADVEGETVPPPAQLAEWVDYLSLPPTVPAPKVELKVGSLVYALADGPDGYFPGRIFGLTAEWANVLWADGYRGRHSLSELALVYPEGV